ncbi:tol-pal system protein YbgF [Thioalbus denitrificans]|uniref:Cell division coordinator CpoB n=1 Tax=Thioalbus denitrificans TaxID=547122 RepID=A0A369C365_9GAMM|nr:tol-pal system protein YbgF [Thioalbus denitrificans]RCX28430.1 tol-pal system protein YbgF [Thioalbus denitrificans]
MRFDNRIIAAAVALAFGLGAAAPAQAQLFGGASRDEVAALQQRVERLERLLDSGSLADLLTRVERLQQEIQQLRGQVETQGFAIEELKKRQRDLYVDVDRRLGRLEAGGPAPAPAAAPAAPGPAATAPPAADSAPAGVDEVAEQQAYEQAFDLLKQGRYADAAAAFSRFLTDFPGGTYAPNAQYWLGEAYYVTRRFDEALAEFSKVRELYPDSQKVPDALLKMGYILIEKGERERARTLLNEVKQRYPGTTAASLADRRLQNMGR